MGREIDGENDCTKRLFRRGSCYKIAMQNVIESVERFANVLRIFLLRDKDDREREPNSVDRSYGVERAFAIRVIRL